MKRKLNIYYDQEGDFLELFINKPTPSVGMEIMPDIFEHRDKKTNKVIGLSILNFTKHTKNFKEIIVPWNF